MSDFRETLYTIDSKGNRRWVYNSVVRGYFLNRRTLVVSVLLLIYLLMPWIEIGGSQAVHLDIANRKFTFFGTTFWATDSELMAMVLGLLAISLFFFTALFGRVWCGWACPQTVFLDFVFRPIEALIEGSPAQRLRLDQQSWNVQKIRKKALKYLAFGLVCWVLSSTALAYFVGRETLLEMMSNPPSENLFYFTLTLVLMGVLLFHFGWFREQFCTIVCPYARFQSVLLDSQSLLVGYDQRRGEPRGKGKRNEASSLGDCIDCGLCVRVCPTGIDIRNGLQLECIQCACCADACDSVMEKIGKPHGLVRYATEESLAGRMTRLARPRVIIYAGILLIYSSVFAYFLSHRESSEFQITRGARDAPYTALPDGRVTNHLHVHISNKGKRDDAYRIQVVHPPGIELVLPVAEFRVAAGKDGTLPVFFTLPSIMLKDGRLETRVQVTSSGGFQGVQVVTLLGPG